MTFLAAPLLALWRLSDGGWHRLPYGSNIVGYGLCVGFSYMAVDHWFGIIVGLLYGRGLTQGYRDWNSFDEQMLRSWYAFAVGVVLFAFATYGMYDFTLWMMAVVALPIIGNVIQPWLRKQFDGHASNRVAETFEGFCVGLAIACL